MLITNDFVYIHLPKTGGKFGRTILHRGKILAGNRGHKEDQEWEKYYIPELKQRIRENELVLFQLFPEFDI